MGTFEGCSSLTSISDIPSNVTDMDYTFKGCSSLAGTITINANPESYLECFAGTTKSIVIAGDCSVETKANLAETATNENVTY